MADASVHASTTTKPSLPLSWASSDSTSAASGSSPFTRTPSRASLVSLETESTVSSPRSCDASPCKLLADLQAPGATSCGTCGRGERFEEDFCLEGEELGKGGQGSVLAASCRRCNKSFAVKVYDGKMYATNAWRQEAKALRAATHENLVSLEKVYESEGRAILVLERLRGRELFDRISESGPLPEAEAAEVVAQVLSALMRLHGCGIVHRDVKLENVMYTSAEGSDIKLIDLGFAAEVKGNTELKERKGTPEYMAPQVARGLGYNETVDMWSLGVMVYKMLMRDDMYKNIHADLALPSSDPVAARMRQKIMNGAVEYSPDFRKRISQDGQDFVKFLMKKSTAERPSAAQALAHPWLRKMAPEAVERAIKAEA